MAPEPSLNTNGEANRDSLPPRSVGKQHVNWAALRARSLLPGGFGADRVEIWYGALSMICHLFS